MQGFAEVKKQAELLGICVAEEFKVKRYFKTENDKIRELENIIEQLDQFNNTEGKVLYNIPTLPTLAQNTS